MKKKKLLSLALTCLLASSTLVGCGGKTKDPAAANKDQVTIKWASWENTYVAREMAAKFTAKHPNIKVDVVDMGGWFGNDILSKKAAAGEMPDIFNVENPAIPVQNKWVLDLKPYLDKDKEKKFYPNLVETGTFDGKVIMLPTYIFGHGVIINKSLLKSNNIPIPKYDWTIDEYMNIIEKTTKGQTIGTNEYLSLMKHIPPQMNDKLGWGTWNGKAYDLGEEWQYAANISKQIVDKNLSLYALIDTLPNPWDAAEGSPERTKAENDVKALLKAKFGVEDGTDLYLKGSVATWWDFTWGLGIDKNPKFGGFEWDFYPVPVKEKGTVSRPPVVADSLAIASNSKHPDEAFEFIKYLCYSPEAFDDRVEIVKNYKKADVAVKYPDIKADKISDTISFDHMPAVNDQAVRDKWLKFTNAKAGVATTINNLDKAYIDGFKYVPDFDTAYHKTIEKGFKDQVLTGKKTPADIAPELEQKANDITNAAINAMKK